MAEAGMMDAAINERATIGDNSGRARCIFRAHGERGYTKLNNAFLQDRRISDETRGLVARLLSLPDDWEVTVKSIIAAGKAGRDKVYRMLHEAERFGYIRPEQAHRDDGKFDRQIYLVSDDPEELIKVTANQIYAIEMGEREPFPENPEAVKAEPLEPLTEKTEAAYQQAISGKTVYGKTAYGKTAYGKDGSTIINIEDKITKESPNGDLLSDEPSEPPEKPKRKRNAIPDEYPYDFEEFWKVYPRREGKAKAFEAWKRLTLAQKRRAYSSLKTQLQTLEAKLKDRRGNFCPLPATWINQGRFDDDPPDLPSGEPPPASSREPNWHEKQEAALKYLLR